MANETAQNKTFFLPDLCRMPMVMTVVALAELFAIVLTLADTGSTDPMRDLALTSLFMQWAALSSTALLCIGRRWLQRLGNIGAALVTYLMILLIVILLSEVSYWLFAQILPGWKSGHDEFLLRALGIGMIVTALALRYFYVFHQWRMRTQMESEARIQALQARIRPHFLFNSMNTIASLVRSNPDAAEEAVEDMADLFRASLGSEHKLAPLADELFLIRRYLHMEQLRLGERMSVRWELEAPENELKIPPLLFQPLVENAVYHGIEPLGEPGEVLIASRLDNGKLILEVSNPIAESGHSLHSNGNRMAVANIRERLEVFYGKQASLEVNEDGATYRVCLSLPTGVIG